MYCPKFTWKSYCCVHAFKIIKCVQITPFYVERTIYFCNKLFNFKSTLGSKSPWSTFYRLFSSINLTNSKVSIVEMLLWSAGKSILQSAPLKIKQLLRFFQFNWLWLRKIDFLSPFQFEKFVLTSNFYT